MSPDHWSNEEIHSAWDAALDAGFHFDQGAAQHLLLRAGFGGSPEQVASLVRNGLDKSIASLFAPPNQDAFDRDAQALIRTSLVLGNTDHVVDWWIYRMQNDPFAVREKAAWMWHGLFCTGRQKVTDARLLLAQNQLFREHGLGSFRELVKQVSRDPAMLIYLDSTENSKRRPNENYARELLELFCLGLGNYTEQDIRELARCFTGWEVRRLRFRFSPSDHDRGTKTIFGTSGEFEGDESIDLVLSQPASARHIARRIIQCYLSDTPFPEPVVESLAKIIRTHDWDTQAVLKTVFQSRAFYSHHARQQQIASPVQWTMQWLRTLQSPCDTALLRRGLEAMGCVPLEPPNVKGWPHGNGWLNTSRMTARIQWADQFSRQSLAPGQGSSTWAQQQGIETTADLLHWIEQHLIAGSISPARRQRWAAVLPDGPVQEQNIRLAIRSASLLPEAHLC